MTNKFKINNVEFKVYSFIGQVVDNQTYSETHVSGGGGYINRHGGSFDPVVSNTYTTKDFFLISNTGQEQHFSFTNKPIPAIRPGHTVEVMWVIPEHKSRGPYLLVRNVSLNKNYFDYERAANLVVEEKAVGMTHANTVITYTLIGYVIILVLLDALWMLPIGVLLIIGLLMYKHSFFSRSKELAKELSQELLKRVTVLR